MSKKTLGVIEAAPQSAEILPPGKGKVCGNLPAKAEPTSIAEFVKTRQSNFRVGGNPLLADNDDFYVFALSPVKSDFVIGSLYARDRAGKIFAISQREMAIGLLMLVNGKPCIALDGDDNAWEANGEWGLPAFTISFACLAQMFNINSKGRFTPYLRTSAVIKKIAAGDIQIVDFTQDEHRPVSKDILAKLKDKKKKFVPKPPEFGFTLLRSSNREARWHRAAWVCLKDREGNFYIMGQDEGSYFCSQLPKVDRKTLTCAEALRILVPKEATVDTPRQGEWFAVKVPEKAIPALKDCLAFSESDRDGQICLPVESSDSNRHELTGNYRIAKDGSIYASSFDVVHEEHVPLAVTDDGWYKLVRNTARRSVSTQGVD